MTQEPSQMPDEAILQLKNHQQQLDMDGIMVGVSRQALDEVMQYIETTRAASVPSEDERLGLSKGHGQPCGLCGEECNDLAGNSGKWAMLCPSNTHPGKREPYCSRCVAKAIDAQRLPSDKERAEVLAIMPDANDTPDAFKDWVLAHWRYIERALTAPDQSDTIKALVESMRKIVVASSDTRAVEIATEALALAEKGGGTGRVV